MSMEPSDWFDGTSDCCGAPVYNPGGNETGICSDCKEHCEIEEEDLTGKEK